jgi:hypothetical protein
MSKPVGKQAKIGLECSVGKLKRLFFNPQSTKVAEALNFLLFGDLVD